MKSVSIADRAVNGQIGGQLVEAGLIDELALARALAVQEEEGGLLGRILILQGAVSRWQLFTILSEQWAAPIVNLNETPPDIHLLAELRAETLINQGWVPLSRSGDDAVVATSVPPTQELLGTMRSILGVRNISLRTTTDWDVDQAVERACRRLLLYQASDLHADEHESESARLGLKRWQKSMPLAAVIVMIIAIFASPVWALSFLLGLANIVFLANISFKVLAGIRANVVRNQNLKWEYEVLVARKSEGLPLQEPVIADIDLPLYTILLPVYNESNIIQKLLANLGDLDYPTSKLEILLLMEENDTGTIEAARAIGPPENVRFIIIPEGAPQTKPRACNYGLSFARGEFVVIYDAEDKPDPGQLRDSVAAFRRDAYEREHRNANQKKLVCVQSALNYFNADFNVLTRMFAIEYSYWFDSMLPGLDQSNLPIPLGGTSNHFEAQSLRELGAWDPYNVTEDADLGLRVSAHGYRVSVIDSTTWEEAASKLRMWIRQRTRWIKGYIMTSAVNSRHPIQTFKNNGVYGTLSLIVLIMGTPLTFMLYPLVLGFTVITYVGVQFIGLHLPEWLIVAGTFNMIVSNAVMIGASMMTSWRRYGWRVAIFALLLPAYWVLHSLAAYRAAYQIVFDPHKWEKTPHGVSGEYVSAHAGTR